MIDSDHDPSELKTLYVRRARGRRAARRFGGWMTFGGGVMSDFEAYMLAQARCEKASATYNWAASDLRNAQIGKRLAEIKSQHEPLNTLLQAALSERDRMYAAAYYVVVGRLPEQK